MPDPVPTEPRETGEALIEACDRICGVDSNFHEDDCPLYQANCAAISRVHDRQRRAVPEPAFVAAPGMVEIRQDDLEHLLDWHNKSCGEAEDEGMFGRLLAALPERKTS